jgi:hypothetical protein
MKLRNLFLSTLVVCAFSACTKDDDGIQLPVEPVDASISFATTTLTQTKADNDTEGKENKNKDTFVNELYAFIFKVPKGETDKAKMTFVGSGKAKSDGNESVTTINHILIKVTPNPLDEKLASEDEFKAVLVANPGSAFSTSYASLADLQDATLTNSIEKYPFKDSPYLPMVSEVIEVTNIVPIIKGETTTYNENWVSTKNTVTVSSPDDKEVTKPEGAGTIELVRLVARVQVEQIISKIHEAYEGSSFALTNLSLVNVRPLATMVDGKGDGTYEYVKGFQSERYEEYDRWIYPAFKDKLITDNHKNALSKEYQGVTFSNEMDSWTPKDDNKFYSYAFPNYSVPDQNLDLVSEQPALYNTALLITGVFKRNAADEGTVKNFRVILQDKKLNEPIQVVRNNVYKLVITLTGEGSSNEDKIELNAHISVEIEVAKWFVVNQTETDVN